MSESYARDNEPGSSDPLAELARLIGQNDPFADLGRSQAQRQPAAPTEWPAAGDPADPHAAYRHQQDDPYAQPEAGYAADPYAGEPAPAGHYDQTAGGHPHYAGEHPSYYEQQGHGQQGAYEQQGAYADAAQAHAYAAYDAAPDGAQAPDQHQPFYADGDYPHAAAQYAEPAPVRRRGGLVAAVAVMGLAVVGTAGAYGYRTMFGDSGAAATPPVIKAAETPNKVQAAAGTESSKLIQDRLPDPNQGQPRIVSREEQPVDVRSNAGPAGPNITYPKLAPPNSAPATTSALPQVAASAAAASANVGEPKKIRTIPIRPEQDNAARNAPAPAPAANTRSAAADAQFPANSRAAARQQQPELASAGTSPMALGSPASATPRARTGGPGSYVQVSSQRSEADAEASFRALQSKYPNVLNGRQMVVRRADLGDKGVYYRAMVGPFASTGEAAELCSSLKAAGGSCVIQRN